MRAYSHHFKYNSCVAMLINYHVILSNNTVCYHDIMCGSVLCVSLRSSCICGAFFLLILINLPPDRRSFMNLTLCKAIEVVTTCSLVLSQVFNVAH